MPHAHNEIMTKSPPGHIRLTSHSAGAKPPRFPIRWGAATARERGPVIASFAAAADRNVIGAHGGAYSIYRALAVSSGALDPVARPDLTNTSPVIDIGPHPLWVIKLPSMRSITMILCASTHSQARSSAVGVTCKRFVAITLVDHQVLWSGGS